MELSEEEKQQVMMTEEYKKFLDRTSRVMERALTQDIDIFVDYTGELGDDGWASIINLNTSRNFPLSRSTYPICFITMNEW